MTCLHTIRLLPLLLIGLAGPALADPFQNIPALEARLIGALGAGIGEAGGPAAAIDRRLKLGQCPQTVQIDPPVIGAVALRCPALGWRIRVPLTRLGQSGGGVQQAGYAVPQRMEPVIRRGDPVELAAESDGFSVTVSAVAQEDGAPGARIRVKSDGTNQAIFAEVIEAGRARLPGFK